MTTESRPPPPAPEWGAGFRSAGLTDTASGGPAPEGAETGGEGAEGNRHRGGEPPDSSARPHLGRPLRSPSLACISAHEVTLITRSLSHQTFAREAPEMGRVHPREGFTTERGKGGGPRPGSRALKA